MAAVKCRSCGSEPRPDARFCDACGSAIAESQHAEFKQVTVLFADVVRSMDIASTIGCGAVARNHNGAGQPARIGGAALWGTPLG